MQKPTEKPLKEKVNSVALYPGSCGLPFLLLRLRVQSRLPSGAKIPFATCMCTPLNMLFTWQLDRDGDDMHDIQVVVPDLQGREVREKVIFNKETHKHPVINGPLKGGRGGDGGRGGEGEGEKRRRTSGWERAHTKAERR